MASRDNVVELKDFRKNAPDEKGKASKTNKRIENVVSIGRIRQDIIQEERRQVKRTLLTEFVAASVVLPGSGLVRVDLSDISKNGVAFDVEKKYGQFKEGDEIALRVYLNHQTYFPLSVKVSHSRYLKKEGLYRHGAEFIKGALNEDAIHHFIKFMESVSTSLRADHGDFLLTK